MLPNAQLLVVEDGNGRPSQESVDGAISTTVHHSMHFEHLVHHAVTACVYEDGKDDICYVQGVKFKHRYFGGQYLLFST